MDFQNSSTTFGGTNHQPRRTQDGQLRDDRYVIVNVWTAEDDPNLPGHNLGHVSIQTPSRYISLWPAPRASEERVSRSQLTKVQLLRRDATHYFNSRPTNYIQSYLNDGLLEGLSEGQIVEYNPVTPNMPEEYQLIVFNRDTGGFRVAEGSPAQIKDSLSEDECLLWVKPIHAGVRLALYGLDVNNIHAQFDTLKSNVDGWSKAGSNILQQVTGIRTNESCSSFAYRVLSAGNFQNLLSVAQRSGLSSRGLSAVTPGELAQRTIEAKSNEQNHQPETINWQVNRDGEPPESDLATLRQCYKMDKKEQQTNPDQKTSSLIARFAK